VKAKLAVRAFVSMVRRTTRINTKLEHLSFAFLSSNIIAVAIRMSARAVDIDHRYRTVLLVAYFLPSLKELIPAPIAAPD